MDPKERQELIDSLNQKVKTAQCKVSTKVEAEKGDYKIVITADGIQQFHQGELIGTIKVADLNEKELELINEDASSAARSLLDRFADSYKDITVKTAAHETQNESTYQMITQKQLDEQKPKLHPRTDEYYTNITQKQLPEHGQRPGTYDVITQSQLRDERTTFYGADRVSGDWKQEDRNIVTEGQFEEGTKEYSDIGQSDRGEIGSQYDGGVNKQWHQIGEKQLMELLKHHKWTEPLTVTEGKDQLGKQEGELARLTAETAKQIIREALTALGKTSIASGTTPSDLSAILSKLVSHESKYPVLANVIRCYNGLDCSAVDKKVAKAKAFGKTANTSVDWSDHLIADVLVRQLAKLAYHPDYIVKALVALSERDDLDKSIIESSDRALSESQNGVKTAEDDIFRKVLAGETEKPAIVGDDTDGLYSYEGTLDEVEADIRDKDTFAESAAKLGRVKIAEATGKNLKLTPQSLDVNEEAGVFNIQFKEASQDLKTRAEKRRELAKSASKKEAQMGGAGGMAPPGGEQMGNPAPPPGGADMGMPPVGETLTEDPMMEEESPADGEPKPPGSSCFVCGSEDVDLDNGEWRCNNCGAEGDIYFDVRIRKYPGTIEETEEKGEEGIGLGEGETGIGAEEAGMTPNPEETGTTMPNIPVGASTRLTNYMVEKIGSQQIVLGTVCPNCGSNNTDLIHVAGKGSEGVCYNCGQGYVFRLKGTPGKKNSLYAECLWSHKIADSSGCSSCTRLHKEFQKSLEDYGMKWDQFDNLDMIGQAKVALKMAESGNLNLDNGMNAPLAFRKFAASPRWKGYEGVDKFPSATCREKIARRFGENATAMSGPCQGKVLSDCVCGQLENLGIYSDGLAAKVASSLASKDPMENNPIQTCVRMLMDNNFTIKQACTACDALRAAHASEEDLVIEAIAQMDPNIKPMKMAPKPMENNLKPMTGKPMESQPGAKPMAAPEERQAPEVAPADPSISNQPPMVDSAKPMEDPMDEPVVDDDGMGPGPMEDGIGPHGFGHGGEDGGISVEIEGDLGDTELGEEIGGGDPVVTLLQDIVEDLSQLAQALQGNISDDMIDDHEENPLALDETEENPLDVDDVTEDVVDDNSPVEEIPEEESSEEESSEEGDIPGVVEEEDELVKESNPEEEKDCGMPCPSKPAEEKPCNTKPAEKKPMTEEKPMQQSQEETQAGNGQEIKTASTQNDDKDLSDILFSMKSRSMKTQSQAIDNIFDGLLRQAALAKAAKDANDVKKMEYKAGSEGSKITEKPAQEAPGIGKVRDGGKIGHEETFKADKPNVPRGKATIGDEDDKNTLNDKDRPTVPHDSGTMEGEGNYKPEQGNVVDGNQGGGQMTSSSSSKKEVKTASRKVEGPNGKVYTINQGHKLYNIVMNKVAAGKESVKLTDGHEYNINFDVDKKIISLAQKNQKNIKESQTVSPKRVDTYQDDPDINQSSGAGKGKVREDKTHSLGVDEKKPSEGVKEPSVPEAPNSGQLSREHTYDTKMNGPTIPAGGGSNPEYDQVKEYQPEKLDEMLGKQNDLGAVAETKEVATKVAGKLLKANKISIDELPEKINELSKKTIAEILDEYEAILKVASTKGMQKEAQTGTVENAGMIQKTASNDKIDLVGQIQGLMTLDQRNSDHERYMDQKNDLRLWH